MSYEDPTRSQQPWEQASQPAQAASQSVVAPGKRTRTQSLPARRSAAARAPVQQEPDPMADPARQEQRELTARWIDTAVRPDLYPPPVQHEMEDAGGATDGSLQGETTPMDNDPDKVHAIAAHGVSGASTRLPHLDEIQRSFGPQHDLSTVYAHLDSAASEAASSMGAHAYTRGEHVAFGAPPDVRLAAHEAAHVVQQRAGIHLPNMVGGIGDHYERGADAVADRVVSGQTATDLLPPVAGSASAEMAVQCAVPAAVVWGAKAVAATTFDAFIDYAAAAILGLPPPGLGDHVTNFLVNLVPFLGEAKKAKKVKKLLKLVGDIVGPIKRMQELKVPGAGKLVKKMLGEARELKKALNDLDLDGARRAFGTLLGHVREAQVATKLQRNGAVIEHLGKDIKQGRSVLTDIDVISREGGQLVLTQVKAGNAAVLTPGSNSWNKFANQAQRTRTAAEELGDSKVRYVVDDITPEARSFLENLGFTVELSGGFLR